MTTSRLVKLFVVALAAAGGCTTEAGTATPAGTASASAPTASSQPSSTSAAPETSSGSDLSALVACDLIDPSRLPPAWGSLSVNSDPPVVLGDSGCDVANAESGLLVSAEIYLGPGRGAEELIKTIAAPVSTAEIAGRPVFIADDTVLNACGVIFNLGPDQAIFVSGAPPFDKSLNACDIATTAATAMAPDLPPS